jgi:hypothetical protein
VASGQVALKNVPAANGGDFMFNIPESEAHKKDLHASGRHLGGRFFCGILSVNMGITINFNKINRTEGHNKYQQDTTMPPRY